MNHLPIALICLAVQVTVVALAGLVLATLAGRRMPGTGASVASIALAATIVLGLLACCPLPLWWTWDGLAALPIAASSAESPKLRDGDAPAAKPTPTSEASHGGGIQLSRLLSALHRLEQGSAGATKSGWFPCWQNAVLMLAGMATSVGLLRLLLALWAIRHGWQRSQPVDDANLLHLIEELRQALGVNRPVAVRECTELTTAATIGRRQPMLLLPAEWRGWTGEQCRAVVAHELAHIRRGDFAAWLLAQFGVAVYFWHPLVRALAGRLRLYQELAADTAAAPLAGGRPAYLRALAELALQADGLAHGWPAPAFLSPKNTLLRRVQMLRVTDDGLKRPAYRMGRRLTIALVLVLTLAVSALRGPVRPTWAAAPVPAVKPESVTPFDLSLLALDGSKANKADGVYGIRLAALVNRPGTERLRREMNAWSDLMINNLDTDGVGIHAEDVEQLMGRVFFKGENKTGKRSLVMSVNVLRTTKDVDWIKLRDQCALKTKEYHYRGEMYVSASMPEMFSSITGIRGDVYLWAPDAHTLILHDASAIKAMIRAKTGGTKPAVPEFAAAWDTVSRGFFAVAIDNRGRHLIERTMTKAERKEALSDPKKVEYHLTRLNERATTLVLGFAGNDDFHFDLRASADTPARAALVAKDCEGVLATGKILAAEKPEPGEEVAIGFLRKVLDGASVHREGAVVTVHADVPSGFDALLLHGLKEMSQHKK